MEQAIFPYQRTVHLEIKTLKYNYSASLLVRKLKEERFTIYRKKARLHSYTNLVLYRLSVPQGYRDMAGRSKFHRIIRGELNNYIRGKDNLKLEGTSINDFGWAKILSLINKDQVACIYEKL